MCHRSGPVELCEYFEKKLLFLNIKSATGTDLWNYVKKCWNIKNEPQVRTCGIM